VSYVQKKSIGILTVHDILGVEVTTLWFVNSYHKVVTPAWPNCTFFL